MSQKVVLFFQLEYSTDLCSISLNPSLIPGSGFHGLLLVNGTD